MIKRKKYKLKFNKRTIYRLTFVVLLVLLITVASVSVSATPGDVYGAIESTWIQARTCISDLPLSVNEYSTFGGTSGYSFLNISSSFSSSLS